MSTSDLYILNKKSTTHAAEFQNGWGSAPRCWDYLGEKYLEGNPEFSLSNEHNRKVWDLVKDDRLEHYEKVVLLMTFDKMFIPFSDLKDASESCKKFGQESEDGTNANSWEAIGYALDRISKEKHNRHARGVVLSCTSVCDMWIEPSKDYLENAWSIYKT